VIRLLVEAQPGGGSVPAVGQLGASPFAVFYEEVHWPMVRLAHLLTGSNDVAEDLVHDAFVRVYSRFDSLVNPGAYLRVAVVNACRSWHRRKSLERRRAGAVVEEPVYAVYDEFRDALAALSTRQRSAIVLRYYEGLSETEISEVLGCRQGTVKSLLSRGLEGLRKAVG